MASMCHIKQHNTNHKYEKPNYVILHKRTSKLKFCKNPMDFQIKTLKETKLPNSPQFCLGCILQQLQIHEVLNMHTNNTLSILFIPIFSAY